MELDDNPSRIVHRARDEGKSNYWVLFLLAGLWIASIVLYIPEMP